MVRYIFDWTLLNYLNIKSPRNLTIDTLMEIIEMRLKSVKNISYKLYVDPKLQEILKIPKENLDRLKKYNGCIILTLTQIQKYIITNCATKQQPQPQKKPVKDDNKTEMDKYLDMVEKVAI